MKRVVLPFTAIVGQERLKKALVLNAINQRLFGLLIRGEKGTAKSTAVRALAELLPEIEVVANCPFNCNPFDPSCMCDECRENVKSGKELPIQPRKIKVVDLPLGATEERVVGTLDIEKVLKEGVKGFQPGLLAEVNQGILYIDEVNLLDDHLVDVLLDAAAMGVNIVEREGVSISHPAKFILIGTMNPEEGEIRPQLLDRFGLLVEVCEIKEPEERKKIIKVVEEFNEDPETFCQKYEKEQDNLRERILKAREILPQVQIPEEKLDLIAEMCSELAVGGHRADFLIARTSKTLAAFDLRKEVTDEDIKEAVEFVLPHRMKRKPFQEPPPVSQAIERIVQKGREEKSGSNQKEEKSQEDGDPPSSSKKDEDEKGEMEKTFEIGEERKLELKVKKDKKERIGSGRRAKSLTTHSGKYVKAKLPHDEKVDDLALDATIRACLARKGNLEIGEEDLREKVREKKISSLVTFVVDASGSMGAMRRMEAAKGAVLGLLKDCYQKRDKVALVAFRKDKGEVLLPPTSSSELALKYLQELPTGGKTPLPDGLYRGLQILKNEKVKNRNIIPIMVLVSDGKGNVPIKTKVKEEVISIASEIKKEGINLVIIDSNYGLLNLGYNREIVEAGGGQYYCLTELEAKDIVDIVKHCR